MRIVFFGASELGYRCCELLIEKQLGEVCGIFTIPREFKISYSKSPVKNVQHADFSALAREHHIPLIEVTGSMGGYSDALQELQPDFCLAIGWYYMIPARMRSIPSKGFAGIHGSLLPLYRGGAPLVWAIINGEKEAGVSLFYFSDGVDDGDIIGQESFPIDASDTIREVLAKATQSSLSLLERFIPRVADGTAPRIVQDHAKATHFPQRSPSDGEIDWSWDPMRIRNFIRAQTRPYPGAFTVLGGKKMTIWDADVEDA